jgi:hypothetical protein
MYLSFFVLSPPLTVRSYNDLLAPLLLVCTVYIILQYCLYSEDKNGMVSNDVMTQYGEYCTDNNLMSTRVQLDPGSGFVPL